MTATLKKTKNYYSTSVRCYVEFSRVCRPSRLAREEMRKQELRQCVRVADNEVMEAFRRIMAARQKKRTPTKKEKDQAWKALKERERILKQLDG